MNYSQANNNPAPAQKPLRFLSPLHRATRHIQEHFRPRSRDLGVPGPLAHLVSYLASYGPVPVGRLVDVFGFGKSTLTGMLDRLEEGGLAARTLNPDDRRSFLVDLTPAGKRAADEVRTMLEAFEDALDGQLNDTDRRAFRRVMDAIARVTATDKEQP